MLFYIFHIKCMLACFLVLVQLALVTVGSLSTSWLPWTYPPLVTKTSSTSSTISCHFKIQVQFSVQIQELDDAEDSPDHGGWEHLFLQRRALDNEMLEIQRMGGQVDKLYREKGEKQHMEWDGAHIEYWRGTRGQPTTPTTQKKFVTAQRNVHFQVELFGLAIGRSWAWRVCALKPSSQPQIACNEGVLTTRRAKGSSFSVAVMADSHILMPVFSPVYVSTMEEAKAMLDLDWDTRAGWVTTARQAQQHLHQHQHPQKNEEEEEEEEQEEEEESAAPDLTLHLGDPFDLHGAGFMPDMDPHAAQTVYRTWRELVGGVVKKGTYLSALGNWEGETGCASAPARLAATVMRMLHLPSPPASTPPLPPSSPRGGYYTVEWGDLLIVVLNVLAYTPTCHQLGFRDSQLQQYCTGDSILNTGDPVMDKDNQEVAVTSSSKDALPAVCQLEAEGGPEDFTLGEEQMEFLKASLKNSDAAFKIVAMHHTVGGNAADEVNSAYGRGSSKAWATGEQERVHALMGLYGAQVFLHGHDHVFDHQVVGGIHFTSCGTTGAHWTFENEGGYSDNRPGTNITGHIRIDVTPTIMWVKFVDRDTASIVYKYSVKASNTEKMQISRSSADVKGDPDDSAEFH